MFLHHNKELFTLHRIKDINGLASINHTISINHTVVGKNVEKRNPHALSVGLEIGAATREKSIEVPQKH